MTISVGDSVTTKVAITVGVGTYNVASYLLKNEMSLLKPSLLVSKLIMNCSSVSFLCVS